MRKLRRDLKIALAGACCGLFSSSVFLLVARIDSYYGYLRWNREHDYEGTYGGGVENLWWVPVVVWHVVVSLLASLLMHRYLATDRVSPFLRWQAIGLVALIGWGLTIFIAVGMECLIRGNTSPIEQMLAMFKFRYAAQFISMVFASNVLFGSAIQAASSEDIHQSPAADNTI